MPTKPILDIYFAEDFESGDFSTNGWSVPENSKTLPEIISENNFVFQGNYAVKLNAMPYQSTIINKSITLSTPATLSFMYKTDIKNDANQYFYCLIDGDTVFSTDGLDEKWLQAKVDIAEGIHTITFQAENTKNSYYQSYTNAVYLDNIILKQIPNTISEMYESFESDIYEDFWSLDENIAIATDDALSKWDESHQGAIHDTHFKMLRADVKAKSSRATIKYLNIIQDSTLSFEYKSDCLNTNKFYVQIDEQTPKLITNIDANQRWRKISIPIESGEHVVKFIITQNEDHLYYTTHANAIYIDNVFIAPNTVNMIIITPRNVAQTFVNGHKIHFKGLALRCDGTVIDDADISYTITGGGTITNDGIFTPTTAGTFSITASCNGKSATSNFIVHKTNSCDSITIGNNTFTGVNTSTITGNEIQNTSTVTFDKNNMPSKNTFCADGYFPLVGTVRRTDGNANAAYVKVEKGDLSTTYIIQDDFDVRIWLRFGPGKYTITVNDMIISFNTDINGKQGSVSEYSKYYVGQTFNVTNTNCLSADDAMWLMPLYFIESDDYRLINEINNIIALIGNDAPIGYKLQTLHDWQTDLLYYDYSSVSSYNSGKNRRHQEASYTFVNGCGVCDGYAALFAAAARIIGVKAKYISSKKLNHAWNEISFDKDWHLTDICWDDPSMGTQDYTDTNAYPFREYYPYFIRDDYLEHGNDGIGQTGRGDTNEAQYIPSLNLTGWF